MPLIIDGKQNKIYWKEKGEYDIEIIPPVHFDNDENSKGFSIEGKKISISNDFPELKGNIFIHEE